MEYRSGESSFNFRAGPAQISFHFCRISWVVVWLCICGEDSNAVPDADGTWQGSFLVLKSHFLFWIRVRRLLSWCPTILFSWENKSVNNVKTHTQHTNWSSCETKLNVVWLIINPHILSGAKKLKYWTKLNTHSRYFLIHTTQPNLLPCYAAAMSGRGQGTPEGVLYSALTRSFGSWEVLLLSILLSECSIGLGPGDFGG